MRVTGLLEEQNRASRGFTCLRPISDEFRLLPSERREEWFRKRGPIRVDFEEGRVYRPNKLLRELRRLTLANRFCLLQGTSATGKTVLVRTLAYGFHYTEHIPVYYFNCGEKSFTDDQLLEEIRTVAGVVIVEDIHLAPVQANSVYRRLPQSDLRHVVFTARPTFGPALQQEFDALSHAPSKMLEPFGYVDRLLDFFFTEHGIELPNQDQERLQKISNASLWLLAYGMRGYVRAGGAGEPQEWISSVRLNPARLGERPTSARVNA